MKATKEEIELYIRLIFLKYDLDWEGYLNLKAHEKLCLKMGKIIFL